MTTEDDYCAYAEECQRMAAKAMSPVDKAYWLQMAKQWLLLAHKPGPSDSDPP